MAILNREFRDYAAETLYPFEDGATMTGSTGFVIVPSLFLDAVVYSLLDRVLPMYVYAIDGTMGNSKQVGIIINDKQDRAVCSGLMGTTSDTVYLYDEFGRLSGTMVVDITEAEKVVYALQGKKATFDSGGLPLLCGRCFVSRSQGLSVIKAFGESFSDKVYLVAASGIHFTNSGGVVYVHMLGEEPAGGRRPIKSVNGIVTKQLWIAARPESAMKVETTSSSIKFSKITDG
jgi:hypothetical protein